MKFSYPTRKSDIILNGLNLTIRPKETLALVGPSGGGKSTVISMILRLYDPDNGSLSLDGVPFSELNLKWLRERIAIVEQSSTLYPGTIFENIAMGLKGATMADVERAAKQAHAHEFITSFDEGYNTHVGDSGNQLSGGQRQRISIARLVGCDCRHESNAIRR